MSACGRGHSSGLGGSRAEVPVGSDGGWRWADGPAVAGGAAGGILGGGTTKDMQTGTERGCLGPWPGEVTGRAGPSCRGRQPEALLARLQRGASAVGVEAWKVHLGDRIPETAPCLVALGGGSVLFWACTPTWRVNSWVERISFLAFQVLNFLICEVGLMIESTWGFLSGSNARKQIKRHIGPAPWVAG